MLPTPSGMEEDASSCCRGQKLSKEEGLQVIVSIAIDSLHLEFRIDNGFAIGGNVIAVGIVS